LNLPDELKDRELINLIIPKGKIGKKDAAPEFANKIRFQPLFIFNF
jgi:hypothetical protein